MLGAGIPVVLLDEGLVDLLVPGRVLPERLLAGRVLLLLLLLLLGLAPRRNREWKRVVFSSLGGGVLDASVNGLRVVDTIFSLLAVYGFPCGEMEDLLKGGIGWVRYTGVRFGQWDCMPFLFFSLLCPKREVSRLFP